ncbi:MAG: creatininase family protein [Hyphomicrobiaceae bacterium]
MTEVDWGRLKAHELRALAAQNAVVILPVAAIEQHGPHLPVMTDALLGEEVARRAARIASKQRPTLVTPVVWHGLSEHHLPFGGTLTLDHETFYSVLKCLVHSLRRNGFRDILISNSHGGNIAALQCAAERLFQELDTTVVVATYVNESRSEIASILADQPHIMHACEGETSMMLALLPELVDSSDLASLAVARGQGFSQAGKGSYRWRNFAHMTGNGVSGNPANATAGKGKAILDAAATGLANLITDNETWAPARDTRSKDTCGVPFLD